MVETTLIIDDVQTREIKSYTVALADNTNKIEERESFAFSFVDNKGNEIVKEITNPVLIDRMEEMARLVAISKNASFGMCYKLSEWSEDEIKGLGFKTVGEIAKHAFNIEVSTANLYARVGKHFITKETTESGAIAYSLVDWLPKGTTHSNLALCLSLVDDKATDPTAKLRQLINDGTVCTNAPQSMLKKQLSALKTPALTDSDSKSDSKSKSKSTSDSDSNSDSNSTETTTATAFDTILKAIESIESDSDRETATDLYNQLLAILSK